MLLRYFSGRVPEAELRHADVHLEACQECRRLLDEVARSTAADAGPTTRSLTEEIATFAPGMTIQGRFAIQRFIASGGMGEVYQAIDNLINEQVALKTVRANLRGEPGALERLQRELRLARRVAHPNVCRVFDFVAGDEGATGVAFLTMEFLEGETLRVLLQRERALGATQALAIWGGMLRGLQAAHAVGVIHRDLKPDNVMLVNDGAGDRRAVITDFGLARAVRADLTWNSGSGLVGTVGYIAPEQVMSRKVTAAADVYAAGVVLHEMLTGRIPDLTATGAVHDSQAEISAAPLSMTEETLDARARQLAVACLALIPARRPSLAQLIEALDRIGASPDATPSVRWRRRFLPWLARPRWVMAGGAVVTGLIIAAAVLTAPLRPGQTKPAPAAMAPEPGPPPPTTLSAQADQQQPITRSAGVALAVDRPPSVPAPAARSGLAPMRRTRRRTLPVPVQTMAPAPASSAPARNAGAESGDIVRRLERNDLQVPRDVLLNPFRE